MLKTIACCCGSGVGSSMLLQLSVEEVLHDEGIDGISVIHLSITQLQQDAADLFILSKDLIHFSEDLKNCIYLNSVFDIEEIRNKLMKELK